MIYLHFIGNLKNVFVMKKAALLIVIFSSILQSCIESTQTIEHTIYNNSKQDVKIAVTGFSDNGVRKDTSFFIVENGLLKFTNSSMGQGLHEPLNCADTAIIIFNNTDTIRYTRLDTSSYNILKRENYQGIEKQKNKHSTFYYYSYTITEEDFQNAVNNKNK